MQDLQAMWDQPSVLMMLGMFCECSCEIAFISLKMAVYTNMTMRANPTGNNENGKLLTTMNLQSIINRLLMRDPAMMPQVCYGQDGEDLILDRMLEGQEFGFYVDVGAHHPVRFSNTYLFYRRGWRGINIDAEPGSMIKFKKHRNRDINIESGVAQDPGMLTYYRFNEPALNTFEKTEARRKNVPPYHLVEEVSLPVRRLDDLLDEYLPHGQQIDFMSVDVEGKDYDVLSSNDWERFRPRFVLAETLRTELLDMVHCPVVQLMVSKNYVPVAKAYNTTFFKRVAC